MYYNSLRLLALVCVILVTVEQNLAFKLLPINQMRGSDSPLLDDAYLSSSASDELNLARPVHYKRSSANASPSSETDEVLNKLEYCIECLKKDSTKNEKCMDYCLTQIPHLLHQSQSPEAAKRPKNKIWLSRSG